MTECEKYYVKYETWRSPNVEEIRSFSVHYKGERILQAQTDVLAYTPDQTRVTLEIGSVVYFEDEDDKRYVIDLLREAVATLMSAPHGDYVSLIALLRERGFKEGVERRVMEFS